MAPKRKQRMARFLAQIKTQMTTQLNPSIPLVTPKGKAEAILVTDYGKEHDLYWTCIQRDGEIWTWKNSDVRAGENITEGRPAPGPKFNPQDFFAPRNEKHT